LKTIYKTILLVLVLSTSILILSSAISQTANRFVAFRETLAKLEVFDMQGWCMLGAANCASIIPSGLESMGLSAGLSSSLANLVLLKNRGRTRGINSEIIQAQAQQEQHMREVIAVKPLVEVNFLALDKRVRQ
jgi:hypothetical protein